MSPHDEKDDKVVCERIGDAAGERPLRVDWHSLFDELAGDFDADDVEFTSFAELKDYVICGLAEQISRLSEIAEQVRAADRFEDLDLGWWSPLIEQIEDGGGQ